MTYNIIDRSGLTTSKTPIHITKTITGATYLSEMHQNHELHNAEEKKEKKERKKRKKT